MVIVEAGSSKRKGRDELTLHPELVVMLRDWLIGLKPNEHLFPKLERKKTWMMVKKELERVGIPYRTKEGIADFHAAGRHSFITGLDRSGATLTETKELARHSDIRTTMRYIHIGIEDQAKALRLLRWHRSGTVSCGPNGQEPASPDTVNQPEEDEPQCKNPHHGGGCDTSGQQLAPPDTDGEKWRRRESNPNPRHL